MKTCLVDTLPWMPQPSRDRSSRDRLSFLDATCMTGLCNLHDLPLQLAFQNLQVASGSNALCIFSSATCIVRVCMLHSHRMHVAFHGPQKAVDAVASCVFKIATCIFYNASIVDKILVLKYLVLFKY